MLTEVSPRPVKPSSAKVEMPIALSSRAQLSMFGPMPPEPWISDAPTGSRPVPLRDAEFAA